MHTPELEPGQGSNNMKVYLESTISKKKTNSLNSHLEKYLAFNMAFLSGAKDDCVHP
jgi:hypothetical protein